MMDISDATTGPAVEGEAIKIDLKRKPRERTEEFVEDDMFWTGNDDGFPNKFKRSLEEDSISSKKRRKQLKPNKIATNIDEMVKVPKQIVGLNNDLDDLDDLSHAVPKRLSPLLSDVQNKNSPNLETSAGQKENEIFAAIDKSRLIEKPEATDSNVPSIEMGPNYTANPHYMFPLAFPSLKSGTLWSEANFKIFNQEAYCELCKKEFCNKYFLKTHKANKHGIYVDVPSSTPGKPPTKIECKETASTLATEKTNENGKVSGDEDCATSFCDLCNKKFCNKYFVRRHKSKSHGSAEEGGHSFSSQETELKTVQRQINLSTKENDSLIASTSESPVLVSREYKVPDNRNRKKSEVEEEGPLNLIVNNMKENIDDNREETNIADEPEDEGDDCSSENIEKLQTMLLRLNSSDAEKRGCATCHEGDGSHDAIAYKHAQSQWDKDFMSEGNDSSSESKLEFGGGRLESNDYGSKFDNPKQTKPTSSYCEICNKELCNKYFMKTHMQRMHGIEIEHGTQIGGVVCNICNKELCSKYFLRVHKQNTHGITSPNAIVGPSTSGNPNGPRPEIKTSRPADVRFSTNFSQICYICNKRFKSPKWLQAHFLSDHTEEVSKLELKEFGKGTGITDEEALSKSSKIDSKAPKKVNEFCSKPLMSLKNSAENLDVISKIFWENSIPSKMFNCSQCPFTTSVLAFLFVHERSHFVLGQDQSEATKPSTSLQNFIHDKTFWQHRILQHLPECLDLSKEKSKFLSIEQNGS